VTSREADESSLLAAARAGDEQAFGVLVGRHRAALEEFCGLMLGDPQRGEQAAREAVLIAWCERRVAPGSTTARMWLYRIAIRACDEFPQRRSFDG
jgi:RNA polymerase sigma-70 factor (ECF subfamily)